MQFNKTDIQVGEKIEKVEQTNERVELSQNIMKIINDIHKKSSEILDIGSLVYYVLNNTKAEFQNIYSDSQKCFLVEALARPCPDIIWVDKTQYNRQIEALIRLLSLLEETWETFQLFKHMLGLIDIEMNKKWGIHKYSINAYPDDILDQDFLELIDNFKHPEQLVIELTEKEEWSIESLQILKQIQEKYGIRIALDDINPVASESNYTMDTLDKCRNIGCILDLWKIDGPYFQYLYKNKNFIWLESRIQEDFYKSGIKNFIIEWIETEDQFNFAKQLEQNQEFKDLGIRFWYQGFYFKD